MAMTSAIAGPAPSPPPPAPGRSGAPAGIGPQPWLAHLERHLPVAHAGEDPEGVHQVRVACARLLVWLEMGRWRILRDDLRWLRRHAARMRELDVLRTEDGAALLPEPNELLAARRELVQALDAPRVESMFLALSSMPPVPFRQARAATSRFARAALRRGRALGGGSGSVAALHRLRCAVRRLRFALEWTGVEAPKIVELQDALGVVCDHAAALQRLERGSGAAGEGPRARLTRSLRRSRPLALRAWRKARPLLKRLA
jgi:CHAD domain-containing protein